jgi:hypothetical protein
MGGARRRGTRGALILSEKLLRCWGGSEGSLLADTQFTSSESLIFFICGLRLMCVRLVMVLVAAARRHASAQLLFLRKGEIV